MKQTIAVFFGGHSSEYSVSLQSAYSVIDHLNPAKYNVIPVGISREGDWFYFQGQTEKLLTDTWCNPADCTPALLSPNRSDHGLLLLHKDCIDKIPLDAAFPVLHGKNGEDGTLQGLIELSGIPLAGCGTLSSALCMDKDRAHKLAEASGVAVPKSFSLWKNHSERRTILQAKELGYPLFVKPIKAGSSYGITRVSSEEELLPAIENAFQFDDQAIVEKAVEGFEVGCAVLGTGELILGEVDEIQLSGGFFDFTEKYTLKTSSIHVPARIRPETAERIRDAAKIIYRALGCCGFARVDMFLTPEEEIVFNEVNTIPGFTEHSRYPKMMEAAGYSFSEILDRIIELAVR